MSTITTYADIEELENAGELSSAEKKLIRNCKAGAVTVLGDGTLPEGPEDARTVRAGLLRYLITGGCSRCKVHDRGVRLIGAYISGELDLSFATAKGMTDLSNCRFEKAVEALQARFELLHLTGSHLSGLNAQGVTVTGSVFLGGGFCAKGEVSLSGAKIGGTLSCVKGKFNNKDGDALNAQKLVADALIWRGVADVSGRVILDGAEIGDLSDDTESWGRVESLSMSGFTYQHIHGPVDARMRIKWVAEGAGSQADFTPQPYEQLAGVLRKMGHVADARKVLFEKEKRLSRVRPGRIWKEGGLRRWGHVPLHWGLDWLQRLVVGYGYKPWRSFWCLVALILIAAGLFGRAYQAGDFAPNAAVILTTPEWQALAEDSSVDNPAKTWAAQTGKGRDYESFNAIAYAADVVVPIIPFGQEAAWAPSTTRGNWGYHAWWARWVLKTLGWIVTALGAAAITGIMRKD